MKPYSLYFEYTSFGFGDLILFSGEDQLFAWLARSGNVHDNRLKDAIEPGDYEMISAPVKPAPSEHNSMFIHGLGGHGWKWRIGDSSLLIHPDGNKPGTMGCVGTQNTNAMGLYYFGMWQFEINPDAVIPFKVRRSGI